MARTCRRSTCHRPAVSSLTFRYSSAEVHLEDLAAEPHPQRWELCPTHAGRLTVPRGWAVIDARSADQPVADEPEGPAEGPAATARRSRALTAEAREAERSTRAHRPGSPLQPSGGRASGSRYAALQAELPRLAAELALAGEHPHGPDREGQAEGDRRGTWS